MDKERIANLLAYVGIILGIVSGLCVVYIELTMSPMDYTESYGGLMFYFYSPCAFFATPFLILQYSVRNPRPLRSSALFMILFGILACFAVNSGEWFNAVAIFVVWGIFAILLIDFIVMRTIKQKRKNEFITKS